MAIISLFLYLPIILVVVYSFNSSKLISEWGGFTLSWYAAMASNDNLISALFVSLEVALYSAVLSAVLGTVCAVFIDVLGKRIRSFIGALIYMPLIIPELIIGSALLMFFSIFPTKYGVPTLVLGHMTFCVPYVYILVSIRLKTIDKSVFEAAMDLGAGKMRLFFTVTLPLILPAVLSGMFLSTAMSLDDVVISFFLSGPKSNTLPLQIFSMLKLGVTPEINALCTVILFLTFLILGIVQIFNSGKKRKIKVE